jgi:2-polyprenyl-3-methyl-5-hydroxy-6-metoxy-1,4-benzoquinol methylase
MFLGPRSTQAEYFDLPGRSESEMLAALADLDRVNRFFLFAKPFEEALPRWLGEQRCRHLEFLDVGAGSGLLGQTLSQWAQARGWTWRFTNLDLNPVAPQLRRDARWVIGSALELPFPNDSFDVVVASQMTHHLTDGEVVQHLREAWRVAREAVMISDLHRNAGLLAMLWLSTRLFGLSQPVREDALTSVRRGFQIDELRSLAQQAGLDGAHVWLYYGTRIILQARK